MTPKWKGKKWGNFTLGALGGQGGAQGPPKPPIGPPEHPKWIPKHLRAFKMEPERPPELPKRCQSEPRAPKMGPKLPPRIQNGAQVSKLFKRSAHERTNTHTHTHTQTHTHTHIYTHTHTHTFTLNELVRHFQSAHTPLAWWRPWLIPSPPHGANYWKVLWGVDSTCLMKVNKNDVLGSHNERHMRSKCNVFLFCAFVVVS